MDELLKYKIGISLIPKIGCINAKKIIAYTGGVEAVFKEKKRTLMKIPGIGEQLANNITQAQTLKRAEEEIEFMQKNGIKASFYLDADYPERLKHCNDAPVMLYTKGNGTLNKRKAISIVGTRKATSYGKEICENIVEQLAEAKHDVLIVSGFAYGIDITAHKAALKNKLSTAAIFAHSLNKTYPAVHKKYRKEVEENGVLASEFMSQTSPEPKYFLQRNRIIAGLTDATIVVESAEKGGSLVTADIANSYHRDVFAFPGRIGDKYSAGCNKLIKINKAALLTNVADIEYLLGWDRSETKMPVQQKLFVNLSSDEEKIINFISRQEKASIDMISLQTQLPPSKVSSLLLNLEFAGLIKCLPGKIFVLRN
ncbi:MAG: DNA-protecting protein DprA [Bacteroidia bacterium]|nr:MAG: DNA-protecting protein DprA [Bacteroidia bacterium]